MAENQEKPPQSSSKRWPKFGFLILGLVLGCIMTAGAGVGMKMTDQRPFCAGCHIMNEAALTHKISAHAKLACNECHAPHSIPEKIPFKTAAGTKDMYINTFGNPELPIKAGESTRKVVNDNCKTCHHMTNSAVASMSVKEMCTDCHRNVQHMRMKPISTRSVGDA